MRLCCQLPGPGEAGPLHARSQSSCWWGPLTRPPTLLTQVCLSLCPKQQQKRPNPDLRRNVAIKTELPWVHVSIGGGVVPGTPIVGADVGVRAQGRESKEPRAEGTALTCS